MKNAMKKLIVVILISVLILFDFLFVGTNIVRAIDEVTTELLAKEETVKTEISQNVEKYLKLNENSMLLQQMVQVKQDKGEEKEKETIELTVPQMEGAKPKAVSILLNGEKLNEKFYVYNTETGKININITNNDNLSNWENIEEKYKLIYEFEANIKEDAEKVEPAEVQLSTKVTTKIKDQDEIIAENSISVPLEIKGNAISVQGAITKEVYKGYLYQVAQKETTYNEKYVVEISNTQNEENIEITNIGESFVEADNEVSTNDSTYYKKILINKNNMLNLLGQEGKITIQDINGQNSTEINKETQADEAGNITIQYENEAMQKIKIDITKPENLGELEIYAGKAIKSETGYTKAQLKNYTGLRETIKVNNDQTTLEAKLLEPETKATFEISKESLSTMSENNIEIKATLKSNNNSLQLYKNPVIKITMPEQVKQIQIADIPKILYEEELKVKDYNANGRDIIITLEGEQTKYKDDAIEGATIAFTANVTLDNKATNKTENVVMQCTNNNETVVEESKPINILAPRDIITVQDIKELGIETVGEEKSVEKDVKGENKEITISSEIINNNGQKITNVKVVGDMPTDKKVSEDEKTVVNNLGVKITRGIEVSKEGSKVYYTENENATEDLENNENGWVENPTDISNMSKYMIILNDLEKDEKVDFQYKAQLPSNLEFNKQAYVGYKVIYSNSLARAGSNSINSTYINLNTGKGAVLEANLSASIGKDAIQNGDLARKGEIIRYKIDVTNTGTEDANNVTVTANIPEGTESVVPRENFEYDVIDGINYYEAEEKTQKDITIEKIAVGETKTVEYEIRVKSDATIGNTIVTKATINYGEATINTQEVSNTIADGKLRVSIKRTSDGRNELNSALGVRYNIIVENISGETQKNVKVNFQNSDVLDIAKAQIIDKDDNMTEIEISDAMDIGTLNADEYKIIRINASIGEVNTKEEVMINSAKAIDSANNEYRSNIFTDSVYGNVYDVTFTSNKENAYVKADDIITYEMNITNKGLIETKLAMADIDIPNELTVTKLIVNGNEVEANNKILESLVEIKPGQTVTIKIEAIVNLEWGIAEDREITSIARFDITGVNYKEIKIRHILEPSDINGVYVPGKPENPNIPSNPNDQNNPGNSGDNEQENGYKISGIAWLDENKDGEMQDNEQRMAGIRVSLLDVNENKIVSNSNGETKYSTTNSQGEYSFTGLNKGTYIVLFEYDSNSYMLTSYQKEGTVDTRNSDVVSKKVTIGDLEKIYAVTSSIEISDRSVGNISIGLVRMGELNLKLDKYISRIVEQTAKGTKVYTYENEKLAKIELNRKTINGTNLVIEYTIRVTNIGEVDAYVRNIADYIPEGMEFKSELNTKWYSQGEAIYSKAFANEKIKAGESKDITVVLTKALTNDTVATTYTNTAEIAEVYNELGVKDSNSTPANKAQGEDDLSKADLLISISTGKAVMYIGLTISIIAIVGVGIYFIKKKVLDIKI